MNRNEARPVTRLVTGPVTRPVTGPVTKLIGVSAIALLAAGLGGTLLLGGMGQAQTAAPALVASATATTTSEDAAFAVDKVHSTVVFRVQRVNGAPFYGTFTEIDGSLVINHDDPTKSSINVTIPVGSVDSNNAGRDKHLKNADFFSAEEFPNATFKSTKFTKTGEKQYDVTGDFTLRGTTKPITIKVKETGTGPARGGGTQIGLDVQFSFKRSEFGVNYGLQALSDEITMMVGLEGVKK
jgi:polyisoprenoid-binding protein YceI